MEPTYAQLIALFAAWRHDIDSEPFAHEVEWVGQNFPSRVELGGLNA